MSWCQRRSPCEENICAGTFILGNYFDDGGTRRLSRGRKDDRRIGGGHERTLCCGRRSPTPSHGVAIQLATATPFGHRSTLGDPRRLPDRRAAKTLKGVRFGGRQGPYDPAHSPVVPSSSSRTESAWPAWRAVSLIRCSSTHRSVVACLRRHGMSSGKDRTVAFVAAARSR